MLKDGLKEVIKMNIYTGVSLEFDSINELILTWYENSRDKIGHKNITYRGHELKIVYDVVLGEKDEVIEETDFITIRKDLEEQISSINTMFDGEGK